MSQALGGKTYAILVAEDNMADVILVREALDSHGLLYALHHVEDGEKAIEFIRKCDDDEAAPCPDLLLLDMNLPKREGDEVLQVVKQSRRSCEIPTIVFTSSASPADVERVKSLGATRYFQKPSDFEAFMTLGAIIHELLSTS